MSVPFATGRQLRPPGLRVPSTSLPLQACQAAGRWMRVFLVASAVRRTLLAVQLDDQLFLYGQVDLLARRHRTDLGHIPSASNCSHSGTPRPFTSPRACRIAGTLRLLCRTVIMSPGFTENDGMSTLRPFTVR